MLKMLCSKKSVLIEKAIYYIEGKLPIEASENPIQCTSDIRTPSGPGKTVLITEVSLYPMTLYPKCTVPGIARKDLNSAS